MRAEIICVGTELLLGDIVNTNAQFVAQQLSSLGISVYNQQVVGDNPDRLRQAAQLAKDRSDIVIYTGGLGPTDDDLTKQTVASVYNDTLEFNQQICDDIQDYFIRMGRPMTENNKKQAYVPVKGKWLENNFGTAPGIVFVDGEKMAVLMPGVPREMKPMMTNQVMPMLAKLIRGAIVSRYVHVIGIGESALEDKISILLGGGNPTAALYAKEGEVTVRLTALAETKEAADEMLDRIYTQLDSLIHNYIYGVDVENIETVLVEKLIAQGKTVATAESCTGGGISARITSVPGASSVFSLGVCTYSDLQKQEILGVTAEDIEIYTAVSSPVVTQMAQGIRAKAGADYAIATTGYAGPGGGTPQEPVGTVYVAVATKDCTYVKKCSFTGDRARITHLACQYALDLLRCVMFNLPCEGVRVIDLAETEDDSEETKPKKKGGCLKVFFTTILLTLIAIGIAAGYLWFKHDGNLQLPAIDLPAITQTIIDGAGKIKDSITDFITNFTDKGTTDVSTLLTERKSQDFFSQGFEKQTVKMVADLHSQNHNLEGWLTFKNSKQEYAVYSSRNTLDEGMAIYQMPAGYISDYKFISGFNTDNIFDLTDIDTVRQNSSFTLFDSENYTEYQIFSVGTYSSQELERLADIQDRQEYIVQVRARSLYDVDVIVKEAESLCALVQNVAPDQYIVAFAVKSTDNVFPSVDIKTLTVYSDWYMNLKGLSDEQDIDALLYAQEVFDRDNWHSLSLEELLITSHISGVTITSDMLYPSSSQKQSSSNSLSSSSQQASSSRPASSSKDTSSSKVVASSSRQPASSQVVSSAPVSQASSQVVSSTVSSQQAASSAVSSQQAEPSPQPTVRPTPTPTPQPQEEILTVTMNGQVVSGPATQILSQIVAIEMTYSWNPEALKAQAIAAHTYLEYQYRNGVSAPAVSGRTSPNAKVVAAVSQVSDIVMTIGGKPLYTPYFASCAGYTNPAGQTWGTHHSHLVTVESKYDYLSTGYEKVYTISAETMKSILDDRIGTDLDIEKAGEWFKIIDYTDGGYVRRMSIDGVTTYVSQSGNTRNITGNWLATDILADAGYALRSHAFTISYADGKFTIVTKGYGHGVGMSQWGAQLYAQNEGWSYAQILTHYYTGVSLTRCSRRI